MENSGLSLNEIVYNYASFSEPIIAVVSAVIATARHLKGLENLRNTSAIAGGIGVIATEIIKQASPNF